MKKNKTKIISMLSVILIIISIAINTSAHSGKTDSNGGHKDNKNKSGLGSYHYHCGGHPAHLHTNGICPYTSNSSTNKSSTSNSSSSKQPSNTSSSSSSKQSSSTPSSSSSKQSNNTSTSTTNPTKPSTIDVTSIQINEDIESLEVGKSKILTATINPSSATDKNIIWKSNNETVATISTTGEITAKSPGTVEISATSSNGKMSTIKINVKEIKKEENKIITNTTSNTRANIVTTNTENKQEEANPLVGFLTLGVLGGGGYLGYKKFKKA